MMDFLFTFLNVLFSIVPVKVKVVLKFDKENFTFFIWNFKKKWEKEAFLQNVENFYVGIDRKREGEL